jgi:hypothetical protein
MHIQFQLGKIMHRRALASVCGSGATSHEAIHPGTDAGGAAMDRQAIPFHNPGHEASRVHALCWPTA